MLKKNRKERLNITEALVHPWIVGNDQKIKQIRRKSVDSQDKVMQFVAFTSNNMQQIDKHSPKSDGGSQFHFPPDNPRKFNNPTSEESKGQPEIASLSNAVTGNKPGSFAAMMSKKKDGANPQGEKKGLFKSYSMHNQDSKAKKSGSDEDVEMT